jgi:hypothetical protein
MKLQTHLYIFFFPLLFRRRALGRSMLDNDDDDEHFACNLYCFLFSCSLSCCSLAKLTFFVRAPARTYIQAKTILDMCKAVIFLFLPILFDGKRERVCLTFLLFCPHCLLDSLFTYRCVCVCSYVENVGGKRTHNHQCNEDEDTTISRWRWRILLAVCKENWKEKERGRDKYICTL